MACVTMYLSAPASSSKAHKDKSPSILSPAVAPELTTCGIQLVLSK